MIGIGRIDRWMEGISHLQRMNDQTSSARITTTKEAVVCDKGAASASASSDLRLTTTGGASVQKPPRMSDDSCRLPSGTRHLNARCRSRSRVGRIDRVSEQHYIHLDRFLHSPLDLHAKTSYTAISNTYYAANHHLASRDVWRMWQIENDANRSK
jgi:hypothetical protein